jgi:hypothetical protein
MLVALLLAALSLQATITKPIAPGVTYVFERRANPPLIIHALRVTLGERKASLRVGLAQDFVYGQDETKGREVLSQLASRHGAVAAVNGDYFPFTGDPLGLCIIDGRLISEPERNRAAFGWKPDGGFLVGNPVFAGTAYGPGEVQLTVAGVNRECGGNENVLWLPSGGKVAVASAPGLALVLRGLDAPTRLGVPSEAALAEVIRDVATAPIPADGAVLFVRDSRTVLRPDDLAAGTTWRLLLSTVDPVPWQEAAFAVGGGPWLVRKGVKYIDLVEEKFDEAYMSRRHPRTAIGCTAKGEVLLVAVEGRSQASVGATPDELADIMIRLGAREAINLDGGGSTGLVVRDILASAPSEGTERPIANGILVYSENEDAPSISLTLTPKFVKLATGQTTSLSITDKRTGRRIPNEEIVWGGSNGAGRVDQFGQLTALRPGTFVVSAYAHGVTLRAFVLVEAPPIPPVGPGSDKNGNSWEPKERVRRYNELTLPKVPAYTRGGSERSEPPRY